MDKAKDDRVQILNESIPYSHSFLRVKEAKLRHKLFNGRMSSDLVRISLDRGDSTAVVMHDPQTDAVILTEQFRYPTYDKGPGWMTEIPAGTVESDEIDDPTKTMRREIMEEIGYRVSNFRKVTTFYVSPGGTSERIHLYYAAVTPKDKVGEGGGVLSEGEDIRVLSVPLEVALRKIETGDIVDAKSIIGLQWLKLNRAALAPSRR